MIKLYSNEQAKKIINFPKEVVSNIEEIIILLNDNYGADRSLEGDLGGYILIPENSLDIKMLKQDKLQGVIPEYTDVIECSGGVNWTSSLFLLSSDFSIVVVCIEELSKFLLE